MIRPRPALILALAGLATLAILQGVVGFAMGRDGRPDPDSFRIVGEPEADGPRQQAFEAARRAIMRCAGAGYKLPADKYNEWDDVEMTFTPNGVWFLMLNRKMSPVEIAGTP